MSLPSEPSRLHATLSEHLRWWELRPFTSDAAYFAWQREALPPDRLARLHELAEAKRRSQAASDEVAFYDYAATPAVLPVLHSQRYEYYRVVGEAVLPRLSRARKILDCGCGPGILTTFYARRVPEALVVGLDRSPVSVQVATQRASDLGLGNVRFECADLLTAEPTAGFDVIICSQTVLQVEQEPGLPSRSWRTFERDTDPVAQRVFEERSGLGARLDALRRWMSPGGRLLLFEKVGHLARRVPFQRALAARGLHLVETPSPIPYALVEELVTDEPLYVLEVPTVGGQRRADIPWNEAPFLPPQLDLYACRGKTAEAVWARLPDRQVRQTVEPGRGCLQRTRVEYGVVADLFSYLYLAADASHRAIIVGGPLGGPHLTGALDERVEARGASEEIDAILRRVGCHASTEEDPAQAPLYESHTGMAQEVWHRLPNRETLDHATAAEPDGRQLHLEYGRSGRLAYVYCANTFDQRQLVIMDEARLPVLRQYYGEQIEANRSAFAGPSPPS